MPDQRESCKQFPVKGLFMTVSIMCGPGVAAGPRRHVSERHPALIHGGVRGRVSERDRCD